MEHPLKFPELLYHGIQATITRTRAETKFNEYRYKSYPWLLRGSEREESPHQNQIFPIEEIPWDLDLIQLLGTSFIFSFFA